MLKTTLNNLNKRKIKYETIKKTNEYRPGFIQKLSFLPQIKSGPHKDDFEKLISLIHEIGHVIFNDDNKFKNHRRILLFEESLAWHLGYDYALANGIEINLEEYAERVELAFNLYKETK